MDHLVSSHCKLQETLQVFFTSFHVKFLLNLRKRTSLLIFHKLAQCFPTINFLNNYYLIKQIENDNWNENHLSIFGYLYVKMFDKRKLRYRNVYLIIHVQLYVIKVFLFQRNFFTFIIIFFLLDFSKTSRRIFMKISGMV